MIVSEQADPRKPKLESWSYSIMKNWRKIEWTTEKGDLNALRSQIMLHANSLNLLINIGTSSRAASIEQCLNKKLALLKELHQWYVANLKETKPKSSTTSEKLMQASKKTSGGTILFQLTKKLATGDETICPRASVRSEWIESFLDYTLGPNSSSMLVCNCQSKTLSHQPLVQRYEHLRHLEDTFFSFLLERRREAILARGAGNSLCYIAADTHDEHILEAMSDLKISQKSVETATFSTGRTHHTQEWVTDVQILQYGVRHYAEILISFDTNEAQQRDDVVSIILKLRRNAVTILTENASVEIKSIEAVGSFSDERITPYSGLDVTIQFTTRPAAKEFHEKVESMRKELQAAKVECESVYIDDAEITIVVDTDSKYRLIIASRNGCTIISQVLVKDFFTSSSSRPNFTGSTYRVQIGETGERKAYRYKNGLRHLSLSTTQANRMLELARSSVSLRNTEHGKE
ncbi:hypothetical protein F5Y09DRAFT_355473 [Xylaria sp. FL1042]|nr:hypothetical protein F5Y09DRAFT_355473 [Xylaria sp. FL1042]